MTAYDVITAKVIAALDKGTVPWRKPWNYRGGPRNLVSGDQYRGFNAFSLASHKYWVTEKQAVKLGGYLRTKEEEGTAIFWKINANYRPAVVDDDNESDRIPRHSFVLRYYRVYPIESCFIPEDKLPKPETKPVLEPIEEAERIIRAYIKEGGPSIMIHQCDRAYYSPAFDVINVPQLDQYSEPQEYYNVLFHEAIHSTGHQSRLDRFREDSYFGSEPYSKEELVAEMGACFLCGESGIERTLDNSVAYIQSWRNKLGCDPRLIVYAASAAQKAVDVILKRAGDPGQID